MNHKERRIARRVAESNGWLASIVLCPHLPSQHRLLAAASCHLLHAAQFRVPKHACPQDNEQSPPSKRRRRLRQVPVGQHDNQEQDPQQHLLQTARAGDTVKLEQLCQQGSGVDVDAPCGPQGRTALHEAAETGSAAGVRALLGLGADSYRADDNGVSPLMLAAGGHEAAVKVLLEAGADPFHVCSGGVNPLMCAARCGSAPCIQLLLAEGVDADYANTDLGAGEHALLLAAEAGSVAAVRLLLAAGARLNRADKEGRTALWAAARHGHALVVQLLLLQPHVKHIRSFGPNSSTTPLEEAQAAHHTACVALLSGHLQQQQQQPEEAAVQGHSRSSGTRKHPSSPQRPAGVKAASRRALAKAGPLAAVVN